jgi:hypothetical protein
MAVERERLRKKTVEDENKLVKHRMDSIPQEELDR